MKLILFFLLLVIVFAQNKTRSSVPLADSTPSSSKSTTCEQQPVCTQWGKKSCTKWTTKMVCKTLTKKPKSKAKPKSKETKKKDDPWAINHDWTLDEMPTDDWQNDWEDSFADGDDAADDADYSDDWEE